VSGEDPYLYPDSRVLRNRLGITDGAVLDRVERRLVVQRATEGIPRGRFDLPHLRAIHRHLFQDIYDWAGELRTVEIAKGGDQFQFRRFIETGMADVWRRLARLNFLRGLDREAFAAEAGRIIGDVNHVHPFREGNGRTQAYYLEQLADQANHRLALELLDAGGWIAASRAAHRGDYDPMRVEIARAMPPLAPDAGAC
jgi:cell filamentation protein